MVDGLFSFRFHQQCYNVVGDFINKITNHT